MLSDYHVVFKDDASIARLASRMRALKPKGPTEHSFCVVQYIKEILPHVLSNLNRGPLTIQFFDRESKYDEPAHVTFSPLTLHVDNQIWSDAKKGGTYARYVLAHEIGHIVLHDNSAKAFSNDETLRIKFSQNEHSAEWQANTFAEHFLVPTDLVARINDAEVIEAICNVDPRLARKRVALHRKFETGSTLKYQGDPCPNCWKFALTEDGTRLKCTNCGSTTGCS